MIVRINTGKNVGGAIRYNERKVEKGEARLLGFEGTAGRQRSLADKIRVFQDRIALNKRTKTNTIHISLSFSPKEKLNDDKLRAIAWDYMRGIGFGDQPFLLYRHFDTAHPHLHIVSTNIDRFGKRIETHNLGRVQSEKTRKELEKAYRLVKAEGQGKQHLDLSALAKVLYGGKETKAAVSNIVREVVRTYHFTSLPEFNAVLGLFNVGAFRGDPGSLMFERKGLVYSVLDPDGNRIGVPIKASSIPTGPTLSKLEKKFESNKEFRKLSRSGLRETILAEMIKSSSNDELQKGLRKRGVVPVFRTNAEGRLYGVTYVDLVNRCVFNGSDLGKEVSANALLRRFSPEYKGSAFRDLTSDEKDLQAKSASEILPGYSDPYDPIPYELQQQKKKKRRKKSL
ncbi:relaxase/mobilization nuclease domain-containing protein [Algoriphagus terrigena]|uniref:relaxase/mobilization nuclease domain-containing protein n=1 Tax=Algoriphagus terrigena TaxID=344884 RepID=UPI000411F0AA|nr:relaxase/mobilization nuclease domain-containing protein [Algoriphagus terrigena]